MSKKIFFLHVRPQKHLALRPCFRMGISTQPVLYWCVLESMRDSAPDTADPCVQRLSRLLFLQRHWRALVRVGLLSTQAAPGLAGSTERCSRRCSISSTWISQCPEVSHLTLSCLIPYLQVTPLHSGRLVSRLYFHAMFTYFSYHLRYYFTFLSWMCLVHEDI